jgi:putative selenate reductase molybdopterin-binding subunit
LHPIQQAFVETGAIQCGFCTPAQILAAKAFLDKEPNPTDSQIRKALNIVLCRCTGYVRPVEAIQRAAALLRGEQVEPVSHLERLLPEDGAQIDLPDAFYRRGGERHPLPPLVFHASTMEKTCVIGKPEIKVDASSWHKDDPSSPMTFVWKGCSTARC